MSQTGDDHIMMDEQQRNDDDTDILCVAFCSSLLPPSHIRLDLTRVLAKLVSFKNPAGLAEI